MEEYLVEGGTLQIFEEKDSARQELQIQRLGQALLTCTEQDPNNKKSRDSIKEMVENSMKNWKKQSDVSIELFIQVQKQIQEINQNNEIPEDIQKAFQIFEKKIQKELERVEKYIYLDLASEMVEFKDIKYLIRCLASQEMRLLNFQKFLENFFQAIENEEQKKSSSTSSSPKNYYSNNFENFENNEQLLNNFQLMMDIEFKIQNIEPKIDMSKQILEGIEDELQMIIGNIEQNLRKKTRKIIKGSQEYLIINEIRDKKSEQLVKVIEFKKIVKKIRRDFFGEWLIDFAGNNKFSGKTSNIEILLENWGKIPQTMELNLVKIAENVKKIREKLEQLQKTYDVYFQIDQNKKNKGFFKKIFQSSSSRKKSDEELMKA
ncbi:hypothetical protein PPERSA_01558 [Pseudocohnilembus persalinus]|uniref:Uncharacterized protein n=1 Tax=Pseudocohnilembus persalinus TaxID=266149 RepID=A0A0V0QHT6_PSEPJ|nr:hypothetical protein PPERSA_01558 [Pseudocohnilembus persalinus]|eukprot:KRX01688.1 hypothetical protein PPERSA_01558 [Pseudocohnilembus persalinus]